MINEDHIYEIMLNDLIRGIGVITYGKERWFQQEDSFVWFDRMTGKYNNKTDTIFEILRTIKEIEDDCS